NGKTPRNDNTQCTRSTKHQETMMHGAPKALEKHQETMIQSNGKTPRTDDTQCTRKTTTLSKSKAASDGTITNDGIFGPNETRQGMYARPPTRRMLPMTQRNKTRP
ncbi:11232_t:CDS:2, partial [Racocetra persica]